MSTVPHYFILKKQWLLRLRLASSWSINFITYLLLSLGLDLVLLSSSTNVESGPRFIEVCYQLIKWQIFFWLNSKIASRISNIFTMSHLIFQLWLSKRGIPPMLAFQAYSAPIIRPKEEVIIRHLNA